MNVTEHELKALMESYKVYTVYGLSPDAEKPSHYVPLYMRQHGWSPVGVYPRAHSTNGFRIFTSLSEVPLAQRRFLNVFRASEKIPALVDEILALGGVEVLWLQLGIQHADAEARAENAGLKVVSNRCMIIEHQR